jgi:hypothetical protein
VLQCVQRSEVKCNLEDMPYGVSSTFSRSLSVKRS